MSIQTPSREAGQPGRPPRVTDLPKLRTFIIKQRHQYALGDNEDTPAYHDVMVNAHSLEYDSSGIYFKMLSIRNPDTPDAEVIIVISRAFAAGEWCELEEYVPSGLVS